MISRQAFLALLCLLACSALACGDSPKVAREKLAHMKITYDADSFVQVAGQGDMAPLRLFLAAGMSPDVKDQKGVTPLIAAASNGRLEAARLLAAGGAELNAREARFGGTALIHAARSGHAEVVRMLMDKGANLELADAKEGRTALLWAVRHSRPEAVRVLMDRGAKLTAQDGQGRTALETAAAFAKPEVVSLLLDRAGPEAKGALATPLVNVAAAAGRTDNLRLLLDKGADINARDRDGQTPLMLAAKASRRETVRFLLERGADADAVDQEGNRALEHAKSEDIMNLLFHAEKTR